MPFLRSLHQDGDHDEAIAHCGSAVLTQIYKYGVSRQLDRRSTSEWLKIIGQSVWTEVFSASA
jgi:hypothetical protein